MKLTQLLGIKFPIIQAPMAGVQNSELALAVSNAGGLGSLPCAMLDMTTLRQELAQLAAGTPHPYNVNFFCHTPPPPDPAQMLAWENTLRPYAQALKIPAETQHSSAPSRSPFNAATADVIAEFKPRVVSFHFGLPEAHLLAQVKSWGAKILASATTLDEARWLEARGVDAIIAQGLEAGGHRGMFLTTDISTQIGTFALLPQIVQHVKVPVIAAGGIADAKGIAAAMMLGAAGVQIGTAYMLCSEARTSALHRAALKAPNAAHTALTNVFSGRPARGIVNRIMRELGPISPIAPAFPLATQAITPLRQAAEKLGSSDFSPLWSGQNTSGCKEISAAQLTQELAANRLL